MESVPLEVFKMLLELTMTLGHVRIMRIRKIIFTAPYAREHTSELLDPVDRLAMQ